ncbi:hypothetical protein T02_11695 [Trichinella nativa]|uniref:Uncharacterized protein n=1 Tax=Trichinella nativa TaxID=6335 RepID=A0A0V1LTD2_9BILA|nr:hypothetical protein T02_11695 [Trichinella nativa]
MNVINAGSFYVLFNHCNETIKCIPYNLNKINAIYLKTPDLLSVIRYLNRKEFLKLKPNQNDYDYRPKLNYAEVHKRTPLTSECSSHTYAYHSENSTCLLRV